MIEKKDDLAYFTLSALEMRQTVESGINGVDGVRDDSDDLFPFDV